MPHTSSVNSKTIGLVSVVALVATTVIVAGANTSARASAPATRTTSASAATVKIVNPTQRVVGWSGSVRVAPQVKRARGVKVLSKRITVKRGGKRIHTNRRAVNLRPGTYRAVITVKSRAKGRTATTRRSMRLVIRQNACATARDVRALTVDSAFSPRVRGTSVTRTQRLMRSPGTLERINVTQVLQHSTRLARLYGDPNVMAQANAELAPLRRLAARGITSVHEREFAACGISTRLVGVFAAGELVQLKRI